jgi:hypothetical protein
MKTAFAASKPTPEGEIIKESKMEIEESCSPANQGE